MTPSPGVQILHVTHASNVAAVPTAAGPARLLETGIGEAVADAGVDIDVVEISPPESVLGEVGTSFAVYDRISEEVRRARGRDRLAVVLTSSCGAAIGAVSGMARGDRGVLWLDRHGDFNTPDTTESGLLDGTTLASLTGRCWRTMCSNVRGYEVVGDGDVVLIGARDLDEGEADLLAASDVITLPTAEPLDRGFDAIDALGQRVSSVYVHVDLDVLAPSEGSANAFVTPGGIKAEELYALLDRSMAACAVEAITFASYDPEVDDEARVARIGVQALRVVAEAWRRRNNHTSEAGRSSR